MKCIVKPTLYLDFELLKHFNVYDEIFEMLANYKLDKFARLSLSSYESLIVEVPNSFNYDLDNQLIHFRLQNHNLIIIIIEVN